MVVTGITGKSKTKHPRAPRAPRGLLFLNTQAKNVLKLYLQRSLQTAVVGQRRANLPGGGRADVGVGETEIRRVEQVVRLETELEAQLFGEREALGQRPVDVEIARRVEHAARRIAEGVRRRRDEGVDVQPFVGRRVVEPPV